VVIAIALASQRRRVTLSSREAIDFRNATNLLDTEIMLQRQCPECDSELVLTRRADNQDEPGIVPGASTYWRCAVCGLRFTAEQLRRDKRAKAAAERA
jgi:rubredoxin